MVASSVDVTQHISTITAKMNNNHIQQDLKMDLQDQTTQNEKEADTPIEKNMVRKKFTFKQKLALMSLALVDFMSFCAMSIMAPFFPHESYLKGMSETVSGFVFSFYALIMFLSSPVFGKILPKVGEKILFIGGILLSGICGILFGTLQYVEDYTWFTFLSFFIRGLEALGASAYSTASYVFVVNVFPDHVGTVRGTLETFVGLGMSAGPAIGGFLFSLGGFGLPFYVIGILTISSAPMNLCLLPASKDKHLDNKSGSIMELIKIPAVVVTGCIIVVVSITWSFLDPTLEPHLRQFNLSPEKIGLLFLLLSALYGISSPGWGWLADKVDNHWSMMAIGLFFSAFGLLLLGPSPLLPFLESTIWTNIIALSILGLSVALALLPTFDGVLTYAVEGGCKECLATHGVVAGMWSCAYSLGEVIGPSVGGLLLQFYGFAIAATVMAAINLGLVIVCIFYFHGKNKTKKIIETKRFENGVEGSWKTSTVIEYEVKTKDKS